MSDIQPLKEDVVHAGTIEDPIPQKLIFVKRDSTGTKKVYTLGMGGTTGGSEVSVSPATDIVTGIVKLTDDHNVDAPAATGSVAITPNGVKTAIESAKTEITDGITDTVNGAIDDALADGGKLDTAIDSAIKDSIADGSLDDAISGAVNEVVQDKIESGEISGDSSLAYVVTPTITTPTADATNVSTLPTIVATPYKNVFDDDARAHRTFQIASDINFNTLVLNQNSNTDSYVATTQLTPNTSLYVRVKDVSSGGYESKWSPVIKFTTAQGVVANTPVVTLHGYADSPTDILSGLRITTSEYSVSGGAPDAHRATSWAIAPKDGTRANVWESLEDTTNKTSITVPDGTLQKGTAYTLSVTFHGTTSFDSSPAVVEFTTSSDFGTVNAPTLTVEGGPNTVYETPTLTGGAFSNTRDADTHDMTDWEVLDATGATPIWQSLNDTSNKTTIRVQAGKLLNSTAYKARVRYHGAKYGWSAYTTVDFTTVAQYSVVNKPTITVQGAPDNINETPTLTGSPFAGTNVTHQSTDWIITDTGGTEIWSSKGDTSNLTSIKVPKAKLQVSTSYIFKVRYNANEGVSSEYGEATYTTAAEFIRYNYIGKPGTSTFGVGLATREQYESVQLQPATNCENENDFQYALYVRGEIGDRTDQVALKFIPAFYIAMLQKNQGTENLSDSELDALLPYVEVTKEQMKEAQRRSPHNAMVVAPASSFANESEANQHGFYLMRGFVDGGEVQPGFFIANTLTMHTSKATGAENGDGCYLAAGMKTYNQEIPLIYSRDCTKGLYRANTDNQTSSAGDDWDPNNIFFADINIGFGHHPQSNAVGNFIWACEGTPYQCCSVFAWAVISVLSLIQGQYATDTAQCAWYDSTLVHNYPKGVNNYTTDVYDSSVVSSRVDDSQGSVFVTQGYEKTTHNGSITGITNVNGWLWQYVIGSWGDGSKLLKRSASIYDITYDNVDNSGASFWETHNVSRVSNEWGGTKSSFPDLAGDDKDLFGIYAFGGNTIRNSNEFGLDYHHRGSSHSAVIVGGDYSSATSAGVFDRHRDGWAGASYRCGFRAMAYPRVSS